MDEPEKQSDAAQDLIKFRPSKRRKVHRQRANDDEPSPKPETPSIEASGDGIGNEIASPQADSDDVSIIAAARAALQVRKARHRAGVAFRSGTRSDQAPTEMALTIRDVEDQPPQPVGISDRFTHQTGLLRDLNDHYLNAYIESRLSDRVDEKASTSEQKVISKQTAPGPSGPGEASKTFEQSTGQGRIMEVDIADIASRPPHRQQTGPKKVRLGRDGKPWRGRKRRGSDDVKRDQLVEQFLHENKPGVYDVPDDTATGDHTAVDDADDGVDADDRLAEQFRRQFMDDQAARRQQRRKPVAQPTAKNQPVKTEGDVLKGPRLGGSRNARAAVRDVLLKQQQDKR